MEIKQEKSLPELVQEVRNEMFKSEIKKSGYNKHLNFYYHELKDIVPLATKLFNERGMTPVFTIECDANGIEYAYMTILKGVDSIVFKVPTAETAMPNPIQGLGAKITYLRRYLYLIALDLTENDVVDAMDEAPKASLITNEQWKLLNTLYTKEEIKAKYVELGITNGKQMLREDADKLIKAKSISDEDVTKEKLFF